ncbi:hypothetical protein PVAP13_1NG135319, partial [Panicum virgatum]
PTCQTPFVTNLSPPHVPLSLMEEPLARRGGVRSLPPLIHGGGGLRLIRRRPMEEKATSAATAARLHGGGLERRRLLTIVEGVLRAAAARPRGRGHKLTAPLDRGGGSTSCRCALDRGEKPLSPKRGAIVLALAENQRHQQQRCRGRSELQQQGQACGQVDLECEVHVLVPVPVAVHCTGEPLMRPTCRCWAATVLAIGHCD